MSKDDLGETTASTSDIVKADVPSAPATSTEHGAVPVASANSADWLGWLVSGAVLVICKPVIEELLARLKHIGPDGMDFYPPEKKENPTSPTPVVKKGKEPADS